MPVPVQHFVSLLAAANVRIFEEFYLNNIVWWYQPVYKGHINTLTTCVNSNSTNDLLLNLTVQELEFDSFAIKKLLKRIVFIKWLGTHKQYWVQKAERIMSIIYFWPGTRSSSGLLTMDTVYICYKAGLPSLLSVLGIVLSSFWKWMNQSSKNNEQY